MKQILKYPLQTAIGILFFALLISCKGSTSRQEAPVENMLTDHGLVYTSYANKPGDKIISRAAYLDQLY